MKPNLNAPVCIAGMHRSGTSLVVRLLNLCGLYLGPEEQLLPPGEGNPHGFWENGEMDAITEELLATLADGWDFLLPPFPDGWETGSALEPLRVRAQRQVKVLSQQRPCGWKDPRASLALPFWKTVLPDLRVVICLRHPAEVNASLKKRVGSSDSYNYNLWLRYYQRCLATTTEGERIFTHYDMYFIDPGRELRRLTDWLGWDVSAAIITQACAAVVPGTREQRFEPGEEAAPAIPIPVARLYNDLCQLAGEGLSEALDKGDLPRSAIGTEPVTSLPDSDDAGPGQREQAGRKYHRAQELAEKGDLETAQTELQAAVELHPYHAGIRHDLGLFELSAGQLENAREQLEIALRLDPANANTARTLAAVYQELGRHEDAIKAYLRLAEEQPNDSAALMWLAEAAARVGKPEQARVYARRVLQLTPDSKPARKLLDSL
ncbi:MAG: tetratricopeptide repeat protein [Candidatus Neomarinimicrobiota bacterium]